MFYCYPLAATANNWLHHSLSAILTTIHTNIDAQLPHVSWPNIIPTAYQVKLQSRTGLRKRLERYAKAVARLSAVNRARVLTCLSEQNQIELLLSNKADCELIYNLPKTVHKPIESLFGFAYDLLTKIDIRDEHYEIIYDADPYHICPFCGCEYFDAPTGPREDLDHYLAKSIYPFAAANLLNLVPMGMKCNERYKHDDDILRDPITGLRRPVFYPYGKYQINVSLNNSVLFAKAGSNLPVWVIDLLPHSPECDTWDQVFDLRVRYKRDVLDPMFKEWLGKFAEWFRKKVKVQHIKDSDLQDALDLYIADLRLIGIHTVARDFLRIPVFEMLYIRCQNGDSRLFSFLRDLVEKGMI